MNLEQFNNNSDNNSNMDSNMDFHIDKENSEFSIDYDFDNSEFSIDYDSDNSEHSNFSKNSIELSNEIETKNCDSNEFEKSNNYEIENETNKNPIIPGCEHYDRYLYLVAKCCGQFFKCRLCHDEQCDHKINRYETEEMVCAYCLQQQPVNTSCQNKKCLSYNIPHHYYCNVCKFWNNDPFKEIFHCDKCNLCRIGKKDEYFHCDICDTCLPISKKNNHMCIKDTSKQDCSICMEYLHTSREPVMYMKCGHAIHANCFENMLEYGKYQCPLCRKTAINVTNYFNEIDNELNNQSRQRTIMINSLRSRNEYIDPEFLKFETKCNEITCNDCEKVSIIPFEYTYNKCYHCGSYNTDLIAVHESSNTCLTNDLMNIEC